MARSGVNLACGAVLAGGSLLFVAQGLFDDGALRAVQDHVITYSLSRQVAESHEYFRDFTYPLPAVIFKLLLGWPGMAFSSVLWSLCSLIAFAALIVGMIELLGDLADERALLAPTLACLVWVWCVQWDFRAVNVNLVFLAMALWGLIRAQGQHWVSAGALLAASVALKLYAAPLIVYLAFRGWWRGLIWAGAFGWVFFALAPIVYFGPSDAWMLTELWLRNVVVAMQPGFVVNLIAYKVSLEWVLLSFLGGGDGEFSWVSCSGWSAISGSGPGAGTVAESASVCWRTPVWCSPRWSCSHRWPSRTTGLSHCFPPHCSHTSHSTQGGGRGHASRRQPCWSAWRSACRRRPRVPGRRRPSRWVSSP